MLNYGRLISLGFPVRSLPGQRPSKVQPIVLLHNFWVTPCAVDIRWGFHKDEDESWWFEASNMWRFPIYMGGTPQIIHLFSCHQHVFNPSRLGYPNVHIRDVIDEKSATGMSAAGFSLFNQPLWIPPFMETLCGRRIKLHLLQMGSSSK